MSRLKIQKLSIPVVAAVMLWLKTYIVYKTSFDIKIENIMQELILFINPLSFLLFAFGIAFFFNSEKIRNRYVMATSFILGFILYANIAFYRFFTDFITLPVLFQTSNFADLGDSALTEIHWYDIIYFVDVIILAVFMKYKRKVEEFVPVKKMHQRAYFLVAFALLFLNIGLAETERPQLLTRTFDREMLVKNLGTYNYHLYDVFLQSKSSAQRAMADGSELVDIDNYVRANYVKPNEDMFGIAENRNLIVVSLESVQSFVLNNDVYGEEVTPFLNSFIKDSYYFDNFYHQTGQGKTSDSEFLLENSLYPLNRGAVFFTHSGNEYDSMAENLSKKGYYTSTMHANNKSFWNRDIMYQALGYDYYYSATDYEITPDISVGWGMKDIPFFEQSVEMMKEMQKPFYTKMITLTNHHPFRLDEEDKFIDEYDSKSGTLNRYFQTVRYTDEAVKAFIQKLKDEGLYDNSIIVMYGDHYGISENHNEAMAQYLGKEVTPFVSVQLQRVPFIVHIPGVTDQGKGKTISKVGGQIDLKPTLLHLLGVDTKSSIQFGEDLFSDDHRDFAVFRDGSFITKDYVYTDNTCYSKETEQPVEGSLCEPYKEKARVELDYSDKIIYGDLLRFYESRDYRGNLMEQQQ
ncbi:phosphoglycerol transferase MdoB-like AlkP superfamily enzyme [Bacillus thermophilus]|uniref:Phosphoglycerol transferase MdoB-like AlkP superfamily enzyme n=1 Tax=Siminovitchia thermophila TaxID=1245522 RepID=A0ABS2R5A4_9BACI|nr:LTA synthase family protein [Siminovitchia thermophila]MBM7713806.1 phosphoglycerol transferase MdoB-like AlkP superfamily enzyme [Siminovitchia thermophila]